MNADWRTCGAHRWDNADADARKAHKALHPDAGFDNSATEAPPPETGEATMADFLNEVMEPASWLVDGLIPSGPAVGGLLGQYKAGKSLSGLQLCFAVARGSDTFLGHDISNSGPTVFIEYEGSRVRLRDRVVLMATKYGVLGSPFPLSVIHRPAHKVDTPEGQAWLQAVCTGKVLCVIGPVSKAASILRENEPAEWQSLSERLQAVTDATGCVIVLIHHTRKPSQQFGPPRKVDDYFNTARGSNSYMGAVDFALGVQREPDETEGMLFYLERDGESGRLAYDFDTQSLCIWPSDRPLTTPSAADRVESLWTYIEQHPGVTRIELARALDVSADTVVKYLAILGGRVVEEGSGSTPRTYKVAP